MVSRKETEKTEGKYFDKDSLLKPEQIVGFDDVDGFSYQFSGWHQAGLPIEQDGSRNIQRSCKRLQE